MNKFLRELLISKIQKALHDSQIAKDFNHPYLTGKLREILLDDLIKPLLNNKYATGSGCKLIDYKGDLSSEMDICVYSQNLHPAFFFSRKNEVSIYPIESILKCIEVKSTFTKADLEATYGKFKSLEAKLVTTSGYHDAIDNPLAHIYSKHGYAFFSYNYKLSKYTPETILNIYSKIDPDWNSDPLISSICIANKGWVIFSAKGWYHMAYNNETKINEEIIGFLCTLIQDLPRAEYNRGDPRIGYYLSNPNEMDKIKNGKKVKNTWRGNSIRFSNTLIK